MNSSYLEAGLAEFLKTSENEVLGDLAAKYRFDLDSLQRRTWQKQ